MSSTRKLNVIFEKIVFEIFTPKFRKKYVFAYSFVIYGWTIINISGKNAWHFLHTDTIWAKFSQYCAYNATKIPTCLLFSAIASYYQNNKYEAIAELLAKIYFDSGLSVEWAFTLFFQPSYLCYTDELSIIKLFLGILTVTISQQNTYVKK